MIDDRTPAPRPEPSGIPRPTETNAERSARSTQDTVSRLRDVEALLDSVKALDPDGDGPETADTDAAARSRRRWRRRGPADPG